MIGWILLALLGIFGFLGFAFFGELEAAMGIHLVVGMTAGAVGVVLARVLKQKVTGMFLFALVVAAGYSVYYGLAVFEGPWWDLLELTRFTAIFYAFLVSGIIAAITGAMAWVALRFMPERFEFYTMVGLVGLAVVGLVLMFVPYAMVPSEVYGQGFDQYAVRRVVGESMEPYMREGDWVLIRTTENPLFDINIGSVVVFFPTETALVDPRAMEIVMLGVPVAHRVVDIYNDFILVKGDANPRPDFYLSRNEVLGQVCEIYRQPNLISLWVISRFETGLNHV